MTQFKDKAASKPQFAKAGQAAQDPGQFGMLGNVGLGENDGGPWINSHRQQPPPCSGSFDAARVDRAAGW